MRLVNVEKKAKEIALEKEAKLSTWIPEKANFHMRGLSNVSPSPRQKIRDHFLVDKLQPF